jgi:hypothetical protein
VACTAVETVSGIGAVGLLYYYADNGNYRESSEVKIFHVIITYCIVGRNETWDVFPLVFGGIIENQNSYFVKI